MIQFYDLKIYRSARVYNNNRMSTKKGSGLKYLSEETAGFRIQPKTVLIMSLVYIGLVILLHIYAKLGSTKPTVETPATPEPAAEASTSESAGQPEAEAQDVNAE